MLSARPARFESLVIDQVYQINERAEQWPLVSHAAHHRYRDIAIFGREDLERRKHRVSCAKRLRHFTSSQIADKGVFLDGHLAVQHADINHLSKSALLAFLQASQYRYAEEQSGRN